MGRNLESQAGLWALAAGRMGAVGLLALISLPGPVRADVVTDWNLTTLQAAAAASPNQRQQRVAAMVDAAMHDAVNSIAPQYEAYAVHVSPSGEASIEAAAVAHPRRRQARPPCRPLDVPPLSATAGGR
jgi:hypothetical protein